MRVLFSGLCVFAGWKQDGVSANPVKVILSRSDAARPHHPVLAVASNDVLPPTAASDFAFVGPGAPAVPGGPVTEVEFLGWNLGSELALPTAFPPDLQLSGTKHLINLGDLSARAGGGSTLSPNSPRVALSVEIARGSLTAMLARSEQPTWNYIDGEGTEIPAEPNGTQIVIADRVEYANGVDDLNGTSEVRIGARVLTLKQRAVVWVTNVSRLSQPTREQGERDQLSDVAMHYDLFTTPPSAARRFVPIIVDRAGFMENTLECVKEMCRV